MLTEVDYDGEKIRMCANAMTPIHFKDWTGSDLISGFYQAGRSKIPTTELYELRLKLTYTLIREANSELPYTTYQDWAASYDAVPVSLINAAEDLYVKSTRTSIESKKK